MNDRNLNCKNVHKKVSTWNFFAENTLNVKSKLLLENTKLEKMITSGLLRKLSNTPVVFKFAEMNIFRPVLPKFKGQQKNTSLTSSRAQILSRCQFHLFNDHFSLFSQPFYVFQTNNFCLVCWEY